MNAITHPFPFEHPASAHKHLLGGEQYRFKFDNGYGASIVRHCGSYGGGNGLWELAVTDHSGELLYDTPITDDVLGWLSEQDVASTLDAICRLDGAA